MNYNVVHLTDKTIEGTLFDRFGRNNFIDRFILEFEDVLIDDVVEDNYSNNFILIDLVYSMEGEQWNLLKNNAEKIKKLLKRKNFILVFCYEYESLLDKMLDDIRKNLYENNINEEKVFLVDFNIFFQKSFDIWNSNQPTKSKMNVAYIDTMIFQNLDVFFPNQEVSQVSQFHKGERDYKYVCYNNDPKEFRVRLVNDLFKNKLDKFGLISLLKSENPIVLDMKSLGDYRVYPQEHFEQTYFSVITESYFWTKPKSESYKWITALTEKVFKGFLLNPFILIGGYKSLEHIKKLGFETFSELFDESYDDEFDADKRYDLVFSEINRVCKMDVKKLDDIYHNVLVEKIKYNQNVYMNYDRREHFRKFLEQFKWN